MFWENLIQMELLGFVDGVSSSTAVPASLRLRKILQTAEVIQVSCSCSMTKLYFKTDLLPRVSSDWTESFFGNTHQQIRNRLKFF